MMSAGPAANRNEELQLTQFLTYRLARAQARLNAQARRILKEVAGLSLSQWRILSLIGHQGEATSSELAKMFDIDKGLFSRNLKTLVRDGHVVSASDERDSRVGRLSLTGSGRDLFDRTLPVMRQRQEALRSGLTEDELTTLYAALEKLEAAADDTTPYTIRR